MLCSALPAPEKRGGEHHLCLEVADVEKVKAMLEQRAARIGHTWAIEINTGANRRRRINLFDPDGTRLEVMEPKVVGRANRRCSWGAFRGCRSRS
jgi:lactoylglutathione lyase